MISFFRQLYFNNRFYLLLGIVAAVLALGFALPVLFAVGKTLLLLVLGLSLADILNLFMNGKGLNASRSTPRILSLGSSNTVHLHVNNPSSLRLSLVIIDELPEQFQRRDFSIRLTLAPKEEKSLHYTLSPDKRGEYFFGNINLFLSTKLGLAQRRIICTQEIMVPVYPSVILMKEFELASATSLHQQQGIKKMRRLGHSYEFEQIKSYVKGDDYRSINWKATSRMGELMVNQYVDEKSQQVYSVIDNSRAMRLPFNELTLLDHAINTSLVISNIALQKQDKTGLVVFSDKQQTLLKADNGRSQLKKILDILYKVQDKHLESDYERLYLSIRNHIKGRSLLLLYTNFESIYALERVIPILRKINKLHLLVVIFFENTEITSYSKEESHNLEDIYTRTIAQSFVYDKKQMLNTLQQYGIQAVLSSPENLPVHTINKYLELKSRGLI